MAILAGLDVVEVPLVKGLPFTRRVILDQSSTEIVIANLDPLVTEKTLKSAIQTPLRLSTTYTTSRSSVVAAAGGKDATRVAFVNLADSPAIPAAKAHVAKLLKDNPIALPVDCLEARLVEHRHRYHECKSLQKKIDDHMTKLDILEAKMLKESKIGKTDAEGFTLVTGSTTCSPDGIVVESFKSKTDKLRAHKNAFLMNSSLSGPSDKRIPKQKGGKEDDFYRFQFRESKQKELKHLQQEHEAISQTIQEMRKSKKFKII